MEIREAVEEATDSRALNQIQSEVRVTSNLSINNLILMKHIRIEFFLQMEEKLSRWFDSFANAFRSKMYDEALKAIQRMTYYHRVNEEIVKKL